LIVILPSEFGLAINGPYF